MELYILRHGIAEDGVAGQPDAERALTNEGRKKLRAVLKTAANAGLSPTLILTSPFRRAVQTAELAAEILNYKGEVLRTKALVPSSKPQTIWEEIRLNRNQEQLLIAGHEPLFSNLTGFLLGCPDMQVDFKKGAIIRLDVHRFSAETRAVLKWMLVPKLT